MVVAGYVVMRIALVGLWLRVAASHPERRTTALRYASGITLCQLAWITLLFVPEGMLLPCFLVFASLELAVPVYAEAAGETSWHPGHVTERYGLFTIIVLGELCLSATIGVQEALDDDGALADLATVVIGGLLIVFAMWWTYFDLPTEKVITHARRDADDRVGAFVWGYGHYFVFAGAAAVGAGIAVAVDQATDHSALSDTQAGFVLTAGRDDLPSRGVVGDLPVQAGGTVPDLRGPGRECAHPADELHRRTGAVHRIPARGVGGPACGDAGVAARAGRRIRRRSCPGDWVP